MLMTAKYILKAAELALVFVTFGFEMFDHKYGTF